MKTGKVYLTGGGCGDEGLLTVRALKVLRDCDTVIYDSLVPEGLLRWVKPDCEKIYVGKRYGSHAMRQPEINALLVEQAKAGKMVVRLKGGDPYVFGRGGEEFLAVREAGIYCEEIPGISSAFAVPAAAGIPVTHRGLSAGVTVVTGTAAEEDGRASLKMDFDTLARLEDTLVILMGMHHLQEIGEGLIAAGKNPDTPCAVIMEGTTGRQMCLRTVLSGLSAEAQAQGFTSPAVIVIGAVAELELLSETCRVIPEGWADKEDLGREQGMSRKQDCATEFILEPASQSGIAVGVTARHDAVPLFGRNCLSGIAVGVTGTPHFVQKVSSALGHRGAEVQEMSFMEVHQTKDPLPDLDHFCWLVFTSPNGVRAFLDKMRREQRDLRTLHGNKIAVIGPGTAEVLTEAGIYADYMPEVYDAVHLAEGLAEKILAKRQGGHEDRIFAVFIRARQGSEALPRIFAGKGISFSEYPIYDLKIEEKKRAAAIRHKPDYVVFGSAMGVRAYFEGMMQAGLTNEESRYVCIGERCGEELRKYTDRNFLTAREAGVEAIVECVCEDALEA